MHCHYCRVLIDSQVRCKKMKETHPEQRDNEVFMGFYTTREFVNASWQTKRRGVSKHGKFPVFVSRIEVAAKYGKADARFLLGSERIHLCARERRRNEFANVCKQRMHRAE